MGQRGFCRTRFFLFLPLACSSIGWSTLSDVCRRRTNITWCFRAAKAEVGECENSAESRNNQSFLSISDSVLFHRIIKQKKICFLSFFRKWHRNPRWWLPLEHQLHSKGAWHRNTEGTIGIHSTSKVVAKSDKKISNSNKGFQAQQKPVNHSQWSWTWFPWWYHHSFKRLAGHQKRYNVAEKLGSEI